MALKILAVDDDLRVLEVFRALVEPLGCEVVCLTDSREAARRIEAEKFDGIVLDAMMPHMDGFELTGRIRASRSNGSVPIILITGQDAVEMMRRGYQAGITFFLSKPLAVENLRGLFRAAKGAMLRERRRNVRLPLRMDVVCECSGKRWKARTVNIAQGGIMVEGLSGLPSGQVVELQFALPGVAQPLRLLGKTTRQESASRMALEFIDPGPQDCEALERFIAAGTPE